MSSLAIALVAPSAAVRAADTAPALAGERQPFASSNSDVDATASEVGGIGDIVVTAQRREERLLSVPLAISAMGTEELASRGVTGLSAIANGAVPSLIAFPVAGNPNVLGISIRGVTVGDPSQGTADPGVAVYLDGVFLGRAQGLGLDIVDPARVEVLRGPQGTLFGRNAEGGAIQIVTRPPTGRLEGSIAASVGDYGFVKGVIHLNLPEFANFSVKVDALRSHHGGFVKNGPRNPALSAQKAFGINDSTGVRAAVRWSPDPALTVDYAYDFSQVEYTSDYWNRSAGAVAPPPGNPRPIDTVRPKRSWTPLWNDANRTRVQGHALTIAYDVSDALQVKSITAYRETKDRQDIPTGGSLNPGGTISSARIDQNQFSQELQLTGSADRLKYTGGFLYFRENVDDRRFALNGLANGVGIEPVYVAPSNNIQEAKSRSWGIYGQLSYTPAILEDKLEITAGLRYGKDRKTARRTVQANVVLPVPVEAPPFDYKPLNPAIALKYSFTPDVNIFVRWAEGYRSGGVSVRSPTFQSFEEEVARSWEAGLKGLFLNRRLSLSLIGFNNRISGLQATSIPDINQPNVSDTLNVGKYRARGVELESRIVPVDGLTITANYTYTSEKLPVLAVAQLIRPTMPKHSGSASAEYVFDVSGFGVVAPRVDYYVTSGWQRPGLTSSIMPELQKSDELNARLTLRDFSGLPQGLQASIWVRNLFDTTVPQWSSPNGGMTLSNPRRFGVDFTYRF